MRDEMLTTTLQHRQGNFEYRNFHNSTGYYTLTEHHRKNPTEPSPVCTGPTEQGLNRDLF